VEGLESRSNHFFESSIETSEPAYIPSYNATPVETKKFNLSGEIINDYFELLKLYLDQLITKKEKPHQAMSNLVEKLGDADCGPRHLLDLHLAALDKLVLSQNMNRLPAFALEGRLLVLEMMGLLVDYYRNGSRRG
jgi:hypothetical protein